MDQVIDLMQEWAFNLAKLTLPLITSLVVAWLTVEVNLAIQKFKARKPKLAEALRIAADLAVKAAEGMELGGLISNKKQYALQVAQDWLNGEGWDEVNLEVLEAAIESAVFVKFNSDESRLGRIGYEVL